jgi:hypothetical protein
MDSFIICWLKLLAEKNSSFLFVLAAILIAATHTLDATMSIGFIGLLTVMYALAGKMNRRTLYTFALSVFLLALPVIFALSYPNYASPSYLSLTNYGPFRVEAIPQIIPSFISVIVYPLAIVFFYKYKKIKTKNIRIIAYSLILAFVLVTSPPIFVSFLVFLFIFASAKKDTKTRLIVGAATIYYALIAYNPLLLHFVNGKIPSWGLARFQYFDVFAFFTPIIGLLVLILLPLLGWGYRKAAVLCGLFILLVFIFSPSGFLLSGLPSLSFSSQVEAKNQQAQIAELKELQSFTPWLKNQIVYSNDPNIPITIPEVVLANIVNTYGAGSAPMANDAKREKCATTLEALMPTDLQAAGVTVVISNSKYRGSSFETLASTRPYLKLVADNNNLYVYDVVHNFASIKAERASLCFIPFRQ